MKILAKKLYLYYKVYPQVIILQRVRLVNRLKMLCMQGLPKKLSVFVKRFRQVV